MRVYRAITREELFNLINDVKLDKEELEANYGINTFAYKEDISYMHFFKYLQATKLFYLGYKNATDAKNYDYAAVFDIPKEILNAHKGFGFYRGLKEKNGDIIPTAIPIPEYAIPRDLITSDYLVDARKNIQLDNKNTVQYREYYKYIKFIKKLYSKHNAIREHVMQELMNIDIDDQVNDNKIKRMLRL